jgi:hypothetical protein
MTEGTEMSNRPGGDTSPFARARRRRLLLDTMASLKLHRADAQYLIEQARAGRPA